MGGLVIERNWPKEVALRHAGCLCAHRWRATPSPHSWCLSWCLVPATRHHNSTLMTEYSIPHCVKPCYVGYRLEAMRTGAAPPLRPTTANAQHLPHAPLDPSSPPPYPQSTCAAPRWWARTAPACWTTTAPRTAPSSTGGGRARLGPQGSAALAGAQEPSASTGSSIWLASLCVRHAPVPVAQRQDGHGLRGPLRCPGGAGGGGPCWLAAYEQTVGWSRAMLSGVVG